VSGGSGKVRFNEKLDHLQARHPFTYNLVTGAILGGIAALIGFPFVLAAIYVVSWAALRWYLWRPGRILRRQYETRLVRVEAERRRRQAG
jgi:hypothetical protein